MKVERIETIHVLPRWLFLKVHTDSGIIGLGEATLEVRQSTPRKRLVISILACTCGIQGRSQTVETAVKEIERYLVGKNPLEIEKHWQVDRSIVHDHMRVINVLE